MLTDHPEVWFIRLPDAPARLVRTVHDRSHPALHLREGRIEAKITNGYVDDGGHRRGIVYLRYTTSSGSEGGGSG